MHLVEIGAALLLGSDCLVRVVDLPLGATEDRLAGAQLSEPIPQQRFGFGVREGDRIGGGALGLHRAPRDRVCAASEQLRAPAPHERRGVRGQLLSDRTKLLGPVAHPAIAAHLDTATKGPPTH